jgi:hypothetical protein
MEGEGETVDVEFQESMILNEEFEYEDIKDPSQGFVDWDSPPTYDHNVNEEDPVEGLFASNLEEEYGKDGFSPMFGGLYPKEDGPLEEAKPTHRGRRRIL